VNGKRIIEAGAHLSEGAQHLAPSSVPQEHNGRGDYSPTYEGMKKISDFGWLVIGVSIMSIVTCIASIFGK
jgi:hypothetical protein